MNIFRPPTDGAKFDYSKIQDITKNMKEKLKQKYESLTNVQSESQTGSQENTTQSSVLDNYITDIENLFLDGVFNGNLYVRGTIYADKVETTETGDSNEKTEVKIEKVRYNFDSIKEWTRQHLKEARIEDSEIWRTRFYNADFVNETLFRDTVRMENSVSATQFNSSIKTVDISAGTSIIHTIRNGTAGIIVISSPTISSKYIGIFDWTCTTVAATIGSLHVSGTTINVSIASNNNIQASLASGTGSYNIRIISF